MPNYVREMAAGGRVAGVDEVGRGPLAGPVVAAAVVLGAKVPRKLARLINDSKQLTAAERLEAYAALRASGAEIALGAASVAEIAQINILHAAMLAMRRAIARLAAAPDLALIDGNRAPGLLCRTECVVGGDGSCLSIAAASIIAKVTRDRGMQRLHARFPAYEWHSNAGYGTPGHRAALYRLGPTIHHRAAFGTVREIHEARAAAPGESPS